MLAFAIVLFSLQQPTAAPLPPLPPQVGDTSPFRRLPLPTPDELREGSGAPGPRYWQQRADYTIRASLDTATHVIAGAETIRYANNSPDTLRHVWLQLDQNIYKANSRGAALNPTDARFAGRGFEGGYRIEYIRAVRRIGQAAGRIPLASAENGTMRRVELDRPLAPGGRTELELAYRFEVPEHGSDRMGREQFPGGWLYEVAQWYPRLAVYDDVRGWNTEQYLGQGEFYLEYGDFDVSITVPRSFVVAATGTLSNAVEVLTAGQRARRGLGGRRQFHLGCERLRRDPDPVVLSARGEPRLGALDGVRAPLDQALLREMVPLPLPDRDQRRRSGGRDGVPDDRVLRAPCRGSRPVRRDDARAGPRVVSHDRGVERAVVRLDGRGVQHVHEHLFDARVLPRDGAARPRRRDRVGALRRDRARCTVDAPGGAGSPAAPGRGGIRQAGDGPVPPARAHPRRHGTIRRRIPCIHPALGLQASHPGGLLP